MRVLVVNAGSSSVKLRLLTAGDDVIATEDVPVAHGRFDPDALARWIRTAGHADAIGHRVVHGGPEFVRPIRISASVAERLRALVDLAPLHLPLSLSALDVVESVLPAVPAVACFDTAFHATLPPKAATYALPAEWRARWDLRRYGFHGLSHAYAARRAAVLLGRSPAELRLVTCHLGAGCSVTAVQGGRSVDTTMGFTPLEGLVMATRSGSVDPGLLMWLQEHAGMPPAELAAALEYRSGLRGLAGTSDMRDVLARVAAGDDPARSALDVYVHRLRLAIAGSAAAMNGLDALVFTGGVGEAAPVVRAETTAGLSFLGVSIDAGRNTRTGDRDISSDGASVRTLVVAAREDLEIAREVRETLAVSR